MEVDVAHEMIEVQNEDDFDSDEMNNLPQEIETVPETPKVDVKILDGAIIIDYEYGETWNAGAILRLCTEGILTLY